ncbi:MAG TPA: GNAT family N-acetyltransferase [Terriglobia bacterium]|nr:GNAT family N-acetyltransferase [Terriglobia bacterium]
MSANITVEEMDVHNLQDANQCHDPFIVDSKFELRSEQNIIRYSVIAIPPYEKTYPPNQIEYHAHLRNPEQCVFFAYCDGALAGELVIRRWWNSFAYLEDITVKTAYRRQGIGRALVNRAIAWGQEPSTAGHHAGNSEQQRRGVPILRTMRF